MVAHEHPLKFFLEALSAQKKKKKKLGLSYGVLVWKPLCICMLSRLKLHQAKAHTGSSAAEPWIYIGLQKLTNLESTANYPNSLLRSERTRSISLLF